MLNEENASGKLQSKTERPIMLTVIDEDETDADMTDNEIEIHETNESIETITTPVNLITIIKDTINIIDDTELGDRESYEKWRPPELPSHVIHKLAQRRIYFKGEGLREPATTSKIPVEISIFGEKVRGIIDSGAERSFLSETAYNRVKHLQTKPLTEDGSSIAGVRLGDQTLTKTLDGAGFVIDIGDSFGPQWFSVMKGLAGDVILGMDFWLNFNVLVVSRYIHPNVDITGK